MEALKAAGVQPEPRAAFLTDPFTSRDLFGVCRGRCLQVRRCPLQRAAFLSKAAVLVCAVAAALLVCGSVGTQYSE